MGSTVSGRAATCLLYTSPTFKVFVEDAIDVGLKRAARVPSLKAEGLSGRELAARLNAEHGFAMTRFPVAVAPGRFGDDYLPVMVDAATIGHAADHRRVPDISQWPIMGDILRRAEAKRDPKGTVRIFDEATGVFMVLDPSRHAWRVRTIFATKRRRYFDRQPGAALD